MGPVVSLRPSDMASIKLCAGLPPGALARLAAAARPRSVDAGQTIAVEGSPEAPLLFLLRGAVRVFRSSPQGRMQILDHLGAGDVLYLPLAFADDPSVPASSESVTPCRLAAIPGPTFRRITVETPPLCRAVLRHLSGRIRHMAELSGDLSLRHVRARIARFLLQQAAGGEAAGVRWTHEEIAARVGTVREVVSRNLRSFVRDDLIRIRRQRIEIIDAAGLQDVADWGPGKKTSHL